MICKHLLILSFLITVNIDAKSFRKVTRNLPEEEDDDIKIKQECDDESGVCSFNPLFDMKTMTKTYPKMFGLEDDDTTEDLMILCPMLRLMERYGIVTNRENQEKRYTISETVDGVMKLGAAEFGTRALTALVSKGQVRNRVTIPGFVNYIFLHEVRKFSHECGLTFLKNGEIVNDEVRRNTVGALTARQDENGNLTFEDLKEVKLEICGSQGEIITAAGKTEIGLLFTFLGGDEIGYVKLSDVWSFLNAELPKNIGQPRAKEFE